MVLISLDIKASFDIKIKLQVKHTKYKNLDIKQIFFLSNKNILHAYGLSLQSPSFFVVVDYNYFFSQLILFI